MNPVIANLKQLYQHRMSWYFLVLLILVKVIVVKKGLFFGASGIDMKILLMIYLICGVIVGGNVADILGKPFVFCLPNHIQSAQKMLLSVWLIILLLFSFLMILLFFMGHPIDYGFCLCFMGFITLNYWAGTMVILPAGVLNLMAVYMVVAFTPNRFIENMINNQPWGAVLICGILSCLIYYAIGRRENVRRLCGRSWRGILEPSKINIFFISNPNIHQNKPLNRVTERIGDFVTKQITSHQNTKFSVHLWSQAYLILTPVIHFWKQVLFSGLFLLCFQGYLIFHFQGVKLAMFESVWFVAVSAFFSMLLYGNQRYDTFLLTGRREYFLRGLFLLIISTLACLGFLGALLFLVNLWSEIFPTMVFMGKSYEISQIPWVFMGIPILWMPLFSGVLIFQRKTMVNIALPWILFIAILISGYAAMAYSEGSFLFHLPMLLSAMAISWGIHLVVLYDRCMKQSLWQD